MSDIITVRGFVASEIRSSTTPGGTSTASFRLGSTERRFDRNTSTWVDGNTNWFTIQSFRHLAGHVACSLKKGQRVIVVGKLKLRQWEHEGKIYHVAEIDAESIGHDLMWGTANFTRMSGTSAPQANQPGDAALSNPWTSPEGSEAPPEDEAGEPPATIEVLPEEGDGEALLVDTETGELVSAVA
ncbi:single-stranded DNA-binding protein [Arthrobacter sp. ISL-30]|uniref:single-stranded DNA-binding protein n=1 Tax=Arthrobacter sp. ISL-30 TaxID=2819109 RepID=UPI001BEA1A92|nr:single-stranded DNA-binding protein [Arthrobacter sp. ISL-30]MBT2513596.1 single-stranded DNA-binding protein [Arthrobacter sp. ISL-30]